MYCGNSHAFSSGEVPENPVKCRQHFAYAFRNMISNFRARRKAFRTIPAQDHEIALRRCLIKGCAQLPHHFDVEDIERLPVQGDPSPALLDASLDCR